MTSSTLTAIHPCPICEESGKTVEMTRVDCDYLGNPRTPFYFCDRCEHTDEEDEEPEGCNDFDM